MQDTVKSKARALFPSDERLAADEQQELALLAEFMRHDSVTSLAGAIAERLGGKMCGNDLISGAGLRPNRGED